MFGHFEDVGMQRSEPLNVVASLFLDHPVHETARTGVISTSDVTDFVF